VKIIACLAEMASYGIVPLTNEPDGLQYRMVCDLTAKGKQLVEQALGLAEIQLQPSWDYGTNDEPHIGSMLLIPEILPILGVYALLDDGCHEVWTTRNNGLVGIQQGDSQELVQNLQSFYEFDVLHRFIYPVTIGNWNRFAVPWQFQ
jgi:hypothetical protein